MRRFIEFTDLDGTTFVVNRAAVITVLPWRNGDELIGSKLVVGFTAEGDLIELMAREPVHVAQHRLDDDGSSTRVERQEAVQRRDDYLRYLADQLEARELGHRSRRALDAYHRWLEELRAMSSEQVAAIATRHGLDSFEVWWGRMRDEHD